MSKKTRAKRVVKKTSSMTRQARLALRKKWLASAQSKMVDSDKFKCC